MIFSSECIFHAHDPAIITIEFRHIPGPIALTIFTAIGRIPMVLFEIGGIAYFTEQNHIRCESMYGPVVGEMDIEKKAVRMIRFPSQEIRIPDRWHVVRREDAL